MAESLKDAVREAVTKIPAGLYFDAHTIIAMLLQNGDYTRFLDKPQEEQYYHSAISKIIKNDTTDLAATVPDGNGGESESFSKNIRDEFSKCKLYRRK